MPIRVAAALNAATTDVVQRPTATSAALCGPVLSPNAADDEKEHEHHSEHAPPDDSFDEVVLGRRLGGWAVAARRRGRERRRRRVLASCPVVAACARVQITAAIPTAVFALLVARICMVVIAASTPFDVIAARVRGRGGWGRRWRRGCGRCRRRGRVVVCELPATI